MQLLLGANFVISGKSAFKEVRIFREVAMCLWRLPRVSKSGIISIWVLKIAYTSVACLLCNCRDAAWLLSLSQVHQRGQKKENGSVPPAFVSFPPLSLDCVFSFDYFAFLVKLESPEGSAPERFNLLAPPPRILSAYLTRLLPQLSVFPVGYFLDFAQIGRR